MEQKTKKKKSFGYKLFRLLAWALLCSVVFVFLLLLFIRTPWGQNVIVQRTLNYVSNKTATEVAIDKLFLTIDGKISLKGLYLEDKKGDTLVYSKSLELDVPIFPILKGDGITVNSVDWRGLKANVIQTDTLDGYNFQFLIDAFVSETDTPKESTVEDTKPLKLKIGTIYFQDFDIVYQDVSTGIDSEVKFAELDLRFDKIDLETMDFRLSNTYLSDAFIRLKQTPIPEADKEEGTVLPYLVLDKLNLANVLIAYESVETDMKANVDLGYLYLELPKADLTNNDIFV